MRLDLDSSDIFDTGPKVGHSPKRAHYYRAACGETGAWLTVDIPRSRPLLGRATESDRRTRRSITRPLTHPPRGRKICPPAPSALRSEFLPCWEAPVVPSLCSYSALSLCWEEAPSVLSALEIPLFSCQCDCETVFQFQCSCNLISSQCSLSSYSDSWNLKRRGL